MARGELLGAFALSEPDAGSDAASLRTQAVRDGDDWVLNGTKAWVTSGNEADVILAMARTDSPERSPRRARHQRVHRHARPARLQRRQEGRQDGAARVADGAAHVRRHARARPTNLLGEQAQGFIYAMQSLDNGRLGIAAQAIGIARAALEHAVDVRRRSGSSSASRSRSSRRSSSSSPTWPRASRRRARCCTPRPRRRTAARRITQFSSMSKLLASETAMWVTTQAVQIFGGYGYVKDYPGRAAVPRRQGHRDLRRHVGDPAHRDRARAVLVSVTHRLHVDPYDRPHLPPDSMKLFDTIAEMGHEQLVLCQRPGGRLPRHHRHPQHRRSAPRSAARASGTTRPTRKRSSTRCASRAA